MAKTSKDAIGIKEEVIDDVILRLSRRAGSPCPWCVEAWAISRNDIRLLARYPSRASGEKGFNSYLQYFRSIQER